MPMPSFRIIPIVLLAAALTLGGCGRKQPAVPPAGSAEPAQEPAAAAPRAPAEPAEIPAGVPPAAYAALTEQLVNQAKAGGQGEVTVEGWRGVPIRDLDGKGRLQITGIGAADDVLPRAHLLLWQTEQGWRAQPIDPLQAGLPGLVGHRLTELPQGRELALVWDNAGSGNTPWLEVWRQGVSGWRRLWSPPPEQWRNSLGTVMLPPEGLAEFVVQSSGFQAADSRSGIIRETKLGPSRQFADRWQRSGDSYVLAEQRTLPSPYASLVEFLYHLERGDREAAGAYVTDPALIDAAVKAGLAKRRQGGWELDLAAYTPASIKLIEPVITFHFAEQPGAMPRISAITSQ